MAAIRAQSPSMEIRPPLHSSAKLRCRSVASSISDTSWQLGHGEQGERLGRKNHVQARRPGSAVEADQQCRATIDRHRLLWEGVNPPVNFPKLAPRATPQRQAFE